MAGTRHALIAIARRRQRPGTGSSLQFLRERTAWMRWPDLSQALGDLPWAVVGAVATRRYMPERVTRDLDVLIAASDAILARQRLHAAGYSWLHELSIGGATWRAPDGVEVDVLEGRAPWCREALAEAATNRDAQGLPVLPLPFLVLMKLQSGRIQDTADLARMLGQAEPAELERTRAVAQQYAPADLEDLESLIALGQLELAAPPEPPTENGPDHD